MILPTYKSWAARLIVWTGPASAEPKAAVAVAVTGTAAQSSLPRGAAQNMFCIEPACSYIYCLMLKQLVTYL